MDAGSLTHKSRHCATNGSYFWLVIAGYIQRCEFSLHPASLWLYAIERSKMSHGNSSSGWPSTPHYVDDESDFSSDFRPSYGGYTGYSDIAATEYPGQSSHPGNPLSTTSMVSNIYAPNDSQYNTSNLDTPGTNISPSYQELSL